MLGCMQTTIRVDDSLLARARELAARNGQTLTAVIEDAVREVLARQSRPVDGPPVRLPTVGGRGPRAGVDLDDNASLLQMMDRSDAAD